MRKKRKMKKRGERENEEWRILYRRIGKGNLYMRKNEKTGKPHIYGNF